MSEKPKSKEDEIIDKFMEELRVFLDAYKGNTGASPFGLCMGPEAFMLLCFHCARTEPVGLGGGGLAPGEEFKRTVPIVSEFEGIPIAVKFTPGVEPMIDPTKAAAIMAARNEKHADHIKEAAKIEGI